MLRKMHLLVGILGVVIFLVTGLYMMFFLGLDHVPDLPRMLYRSAHIYLLLTSLTNLALGFYLPPGKESLKTVASFLILISPALMLTAFFIEPKFPSFERPFAGPGVYSVFAGMMLFLLSYLHRLNSKP